MVTGASRGLGAHLARELSREGYDLILHHRSGRAEAIRVAETIRQEGGRAEIFSADLSHPSQVETLFRKVRHRHLLHHPLRVAPFPQDRRTDHQPG